jgi:hypothetical protein
VGDILGLADFFINRVGHDGWRVCFSKVEVAVKKRRSELVGVGVLLSSGDGEELKLGRSGRDLVAWLDAAVVNSESCRCREISCADFRG